MNKSSSLLLQLYLLHFLIMNKSSYFTQKKKKKKKKKNKKEIFKKGLGTRGIGLVLLRLLSKKKNQNFQFQEKIQDFQIFSKKKKIHQSNFQFLKIIQKKIHESKF